VTAGVVAKAKSSQRNTKAMTRKSLTARPNKRLDVHLQQCPSTQLSLRLNAPAVTTRGAAAAAAAEEVAAVVGCPRKKSFACQEQH
jgi:hypothetical protein